MLLPPHPQMSIAFLNQLFLSFSSLLQYSALLFYQLVAETLVNSFDLAIFSIINYTRQ